MFREYIFSKINSLSTHLVIQKFVAYITRVRVEPNTMSAGGKVRGSCAW
jgi:hypothetical protein